MPRPGPVVVGAALVDRRGGPPRLLAAQRDRPVELAGRWAFPGGKVQPGEGEEEGLHREIAEELGVDIVVTERIGPDVALPNGAVLRVWLAEVATGRPVAREHRALRWLSADELFTVPWIPADLPVVDAVQTWLSRSAEPTG